MTWSWRHPIAALDLWWDETSSTRRLDHYPANLCMLIGLLLTSSSIVLQGPSPTSVLVDMSDPLQVAMCACIFGGCLIKLHGIASHTRFWFPHKPLRKCYQLGYTGAPLSTSGLLVYGYYILSNTPTWLSALGGVLTPLLGVGIALQGCVYWLEARRIERRERQMISIAKRNKEIMEGNQ